MSDWNGWLSPTGNLFECEPEKHYLFIGQIIDTIDSWVHVTPNSCYGDKDLTIQQINWIREFGNEIHLKDLEMMLQRNVAQSHPLASI